MFPETINRHYQPKFFREGSADALLITFAASIRRPKPKARTNQFVFLACAERCTTTISVVLISISFLLTTDSSIQTKSNNSSNYVAKYDGVYFLFAIMKNQVQNEHCLIYRTSVFVV
jgi:hypothetical protein